MRSVMATRSPARSVSDEGSKARSLITISICRVAPGATGPGVGMSMRDTVWKLGSVMLEAMAARSTNPLLDLVAAR